MSDTTYLVILAIDVDASGPFEAASKAQRHLTNMDERTWNSIPHESDDYHAMTALLVRSQAETVHHPQRPLTDDAGDGTLSGRRRAPVVQR